MAGVHGSAVIARSIATKRSMTKGAALRPLDCFASLAMTAPPDGVRIGRHREERSDEAIHDEGLRPLDCVASLAMTASSLADAANSSRRGGRDQRPAGNRGENIVLAALAARGILGHDAIDHVTEILRI